MSRQPPRSTLFPYPTLVRAAAIPASPASLAEAGREALEKAVSETVERQMAELSAVSERAIETARRASERLTRQMVSLGETAAAIEARIDEERREREEKESENFSKIGRAHV